MTAPTTRETADHAELARLAEVAESEARNPDLWVSVVTLNDFNQAANPARVLSLLSEIAALRGERDRWHSAYEIAHDQAMANGSAARQAERQRDELRAEGQKFADFIIQMNAPDQGECLTEDERLMFAVASKFRALIANQGADQ